MLTKFRVVREAITYNILNPKDKRDLDVSPYLIQNKDGVISMNIPIYSHFPIHLSDLVRIRREFIVENYVDDLYFINIKTIDEAIKDWLIYIYENSSEIMKTILHYIINLDKLNHIDDRMISVRKEMDNLISNNTMLEKLFITRIDKKIDKIGYSNIIQSDDIEFEKSLFNEMKDLYSAKVEKLHKLENEVKQLNFTINEISFTI